VSLDSRDPAVSLNFAVFLSNQRDVVGAARQLKDFEARVVKLRQTPGSQGLIGQGGQAQTDSR